MASGYEFTADQNALIDRLAQRMRMVGRLLMIVAVLAIGESGWMLWHHNGGVTGLEIGVVLLLIGFWSVQAGGEFRQVSHTRGADIDHLMHALGQVRKLYDLQFWIFVVLAVLLSLALISVAAGPGRLTGPYP